MSCGTNHLIMLLELVLFVLLYSTTLLQYSYGFTSLANNTNQYFTGNNNTGFVTLDQLSAVAVMDLTGSIREGSYMVTLKLGQHAQEYTFVIDTGSDLTWVNCDTTSPYHYPHPPYNPQQHNPVFCGDPVCLVAHPSNHPCNNTTDICYFNVRYVDEGSTTGMMIVDSLTLPFRNVHSSLQHPSIKFGCASDTHHPPSTRDGQNIKYDGVLGLAKNSPVTILDQLVKKGIVQPVFGHCIARPRDGYFFIGAGKVLPATITWARMGALRDVRHYSPGPANLLFDGGHTSVTNLHTVFDSGSTFSFFKKSAIREMIKLVKASLVRAPLTPVKDNFYPICWQHVQSPIRSLDEVAAYFKTMTLHFPTSNSARFDLPPYTYLTVTSRGRVCFTILDNANHGLGEVNLIGGTFFQDKLVIYDLVRKRIGWAHSNCTDRGMNDRKQHHATNLMYRHGDLPRHHFSTNVPVRGQTPLANYTSIYQTMM